jgi:hypothetical protein
VGVERGDLGVDGLDPAGEGDDGGLDRVIQGIAAWPGT